MKDLLKVWVDLKVYKTVLQQILYEYSKTLDVIEIIKGIDTELSSLKMIK